MSKPQPFDPGYDYEADKDITERLDANKKLCLLENAKAAALMDEAAGEIRALRILCSCLRRRFNDLEAEIEHESEE